MLRHDEGYHEASGDGADAKPYDNWFDSIETDPSRWGAASSRRRSRRNAIRRWRGRATGAAAAPVAEPSAGSGTRSLPGTAGTTEIAAARAGSRARTARRRP